MRRVILLSMFLSSTTVVVAYAAPPQIPPLSPSPPYGAPITLAEAKTVAAAANSELAREKADGAVIAIVQPDGSLVYFEKMDGSTYVSIEFAQAKARTAAITRHATGEMGPPGTAEPMPDLLAEAVNHVVNALPGAVEPLHNLIALPGGVPIVIGGRTVGAIGVSGVEGGDAKVAEIAAAAVSNGAPK